ncbi:Arylalkylamine N-acetyltransferase 1 [Pseudolycoriella hygida]|uniref:Arylalkylamine N-acetyltransferase 1 n=1 Tax=Pseudolycoriella hygida TaxID=35572 RepID=A0A9Q0MXS5_9DIPT|nr:Arylalkylamine N-acetyltransferase 1 [Pseudolycoriella hygida]
MAGKWLTLRWTRPKTVDYPKVWRTFTGRDLDSDKLIEYRIEDLTESRFDDAIRHLEAFYLRDEPVSQVLGGRNDAQYVADYRMICRSILQQKTSLVCFRACSDSIVGVQTNYIRTIADDFGKQAYERSQSPKTRKMYDVDSVLTKQFNAFDTYGVSEYFYLHNQSVDERFRGLNIGFHFFEAGKNFCRESNIKLMHGIFTSNFSSQAGVAFGFKQDLAISFDELIKYHPELDMQGIKSERLSLKSAKV